MNDYDFSALDIILDYHEKHGRYPKQIEVTAMYREEMRCTYFDFEKPASEPREVIVTRVPVVPLGTGDIIFRGLLLQSEDSNLEQAKCKTQEKFQRLGARLARAGCLLIEPKQHWGQHSLPPFLFYSQIEVYAFGEQAAFTLAMAAEEQNLPGD